MSTPIMKKEYAEKLLQTKCWEVRRKLKGKQINFHTQTLWFNPSSEYNANRQISFSSYKESVITEYSKTANELQICSITSIRPEEMFFILEFVVSFCQL